MPPPGADFGGPISVQILQRERSQDPSGGHPLYCVPDVVHRAAEGLVVACVRRLRSFHLRPPCTKLLVRSDVKGVRRSAAEGLVVARVIDDIASDKVAY
eukprot:218182-Pyramimonas_sp.AAC.1